MGLLSSPLWPGQERWRCEGRARSGSPRSSRSLLGRRSQGLQEELGLRSGSSAPPGRQRQKERHVRGWRGPAKARGQRPWPLQGALPAPSAAPLTTWDPFQSLSLGTKEPGQFSHLKAAGWGRCCSLRECWEANPWWEMESRKIIVVVIHPCVTSEHPAGLRCCHGTAALRFLNGFITYQPAPSGLCLPPCSCGFLAPLEIPEDQFAPGIPRAPGAAGLCSAQVAAPRGSTFSCCFM